MSRCTDLRSHRLQHGSSTRARLLSTLWRHVLLSCLPLLCGFGTLTASETDYADHFARSIAEEKAGDLERARIEIERALSDYPDDYTLSLRLGWIYFLQERYADAERAYRTASKVSKQSPLSQLGLAWTLVRERRCDEARELLSTIDAAEHQTNVEAALAACKELSALHGSVWTTLGGALYQDHPWKRRSADALVGASLSLAGRWYTGGVYHYLKLQARDPRVDTVMQNEGYLQAGYAGERFGLSLHGALLFAGYSALGRSAHFAVAGRLTHFGSIALELSGSIYPDFFVTRIAPAWELSFGSLSVVPGIGFEHYLQKNLVSGSLGVGYKISRLSLSAGGKYGPEYRAAYLSSFAVFNSEDHSVWGAWALARANLSSHVNVFVTYAVNELDTPDKTPTRVQLLSLGAACNL